ncbi:MAG: hypothetical protein GX625_07350, partial [Clostridiaceae bacterium]|nr:hypothetical protein [Clostridiaceae bacterium]
MDNEISTRSLDEKGDTIIIEGVYNRNVFYFGVGLAIICIVFSIISLTSGQDNMFAGLDYLMIAGGGYALYISIKEIILNRKRKLCVTENRVFGNTGRDPFDIPLNDIVNVEQQSRKDFVNGKTEYLFIKTNNNEIKIEQLKN